MSVVFGRPITGEIVKSGHYEVEQWPGEQFLPLLDNLLAQSNVESVRWTQYTPYFNDGEPCIFGVNDPYVKLLEGYEDKGDYGDGYLSTYSMVDRSKGYPLAYSPVYPGLEDISVALKQLEESLPHFEDFLQETFGDHATVTATTKGFDIEFYEHD